MEGRKEGSRDLRGMMGSREEVKRVALCCVVRELVPVIRIRGSRRSESDREYRQSRGSQAREKRKE